MIYMKFYGDKIYLSLKKIRPVLRYFPTQKGLKEVDFKPSNPLMAVIEDDDGYNIHYGNRKLTKLIPQYFEFDDKEKSVEVNIDGISKKIKLGSKIKVSEYFNVTPESGYRVNVIGYINRKHKNESGLNIRKKYIISRFSVDEKGDIYRVEFYDDQNRFSGMFLAEFGKAKKSSQNMSVAFTHY